MDKKLICQNKFEFNHQTIGLPIELENLPSRLKIENVDLILQTSFHVSLVCIGQIIKKYNVSIYDFENKVINDFCEFAGNNNIKILEYCDFKFVQKDDLKTVIVMCRVSNLDKFFTIIYKKYGLEIEYPPTHVTLYILESKHGIFLTDSVDIQNLTKPISNPIGRPL